MFSTFGVYIYILNITNIHNKYRYSYLCKPILFETYKTYFYSRNTTNFCNYYSKRFETFVGLNKVHELHSS